MRIMGPPTTTWPTVQTMLRRLNADPLFLNDMAPALWAAGEKWGVDPLGVVAQSVKETNWGRFGGNVRPEFRNTCGLKIQPLGILPEASGDKPLAHSLFASWTVGATAHVQHLRAYANGPVPTSEVVDPRYWLVFGKHHDVLDFEQLGGRWAPSPTYGEEIVALARKLTEVSL